MEMWRMIYEFPRYEISSSGRCVNGDTGKLIRPHVIDGLYQVYYFHHHSHKYKRMVGRLVLTAFVRDPRRGEIVRHKDGDLLNDNLENLEWTTYRERALDFKKPDDFQYLLVEEAGVVFKSHQEVADFLEVSLGTVHSSVYRGYKIRGYTITKLE